MCLECHVVCVEIEVKDLDALQAACKRLGWQFCRDQHTYEWYGRWEKDYHKDDAAYKHGHDTKDYGKCDHAIHVPGCEYEIGVVRQDGRFALIWDFVDHALCTKLGGPTAPTLKHTYTLELERLKAQAEGYSAQEIDATEYTDLVLTSYT